MNIQLFYNRGHRDREGRLVADQEHSAGFFQLDPQDIKFTRLGPVASHRGNRLTLRTTTTNWSDRKTTTKRRTTWCKASTRASPVFSKESARASRD